MLDDAKYVSKEHYLFYKISIIPKGSTAGMELGVGHLI
jgi:hypothetical protein